MSNQGDRSVSLRFRFQNNLKRLCTHMNFVLSFLILIGVAMVMIPPQSWDPVNEPQGLRNVYKDTRVYAVRDVFVMAVGLVSIYLTLWETSTFTNTASEMQEVARQLECPNAILEMELSTCVPFIPSHPIPSITVVSFSVREIRVALYCE